MYLKIISLVFILWTSIHIYFLQLNQIVKTSLWFENIKLINYFKDLSINGFWDWSIWFLYSLLIAPIDFFIKNTLFSSQIINIILLFISWILLFSLWKKYLHSTYNTLLIIIFFISSNIINYTNNIDAINLYIPLLLALILVLHSLISETAIKTMTVQIKWINVEVNNNNDIIKKSVFVSIVLSLLFFTINISIIYIISILFILLYLLFSKKLNFKIFLISYTSILVTFLIIISPYIWLTWTKEYSNEISSYIINSKIIIQENNNITLEKTTWKLSKIFPNIILGNILDSYNDRNFIFFKNKIFYIYILIPILFLFIWIYILLFNKKISLTEKKNLFPIVFSIFITILIFFSFFSISTINFIVLIPIFILIICIWAQNIIVFEKDILSSIKFLTISFIFISIYFQWVLHLYIYNQYNDRKVETLKDMWLWLKNNEIVGKNSKIISTLPTVWYYSWYFNIWDIPKVNNTKELIKYVKVNNIKILVVDSLLITKKNPMLKELIQDDYKNSSLEKIKEINTIWQKIILYKVKY